MKRKSTKTPRVKLPVLISYHYLRAQSDRLIEWTVTNPNFELLIDSGAFSALNVGSEIDLDEYIAFCHKWQKYLFGYMALDKLFDPVQTEKNLKRMLKEGLKPIPVHVLGDDGKRMDELFGYSDWVALGGLRRPQRGPAPKSYIKQKMLWARGRKVHWLGYTRKEMLEAFRPYSCDCSSWASGMMYGRLTFYYGHGRWTNFDREQMMSRRLHDNHRFRQALSYYEVPMSMMLDERHWHNGNSKKHDLPAAKCMITQLPAKCWARYVVDFKERFGTRIFIAIHDNQVPWMSDAADFLNRKLLQLSP